MKREVRIRRYAGSVTGWRFVPGSFTFPELKAAFGALELSVVGPAIDSNPPSLNTLALNRRPSMNKLTAVATMLFSAAMTPKHAFIEESRVAYWFFSLNDAAEIQFHGSALNDAVVANQFIQTLPSDSNGTIYLMVEASTGAFLDMAEPAGSVASASASMSGAPSAATEESNKTQTFSLMRIWSFDDEMNDLANWTLHSAELMGQSVGDNYVVRVSYSLSEVSPAN